jgi:tetratricopeptide (TPR) repeat protein
VEQDRLVEIKSNLYRLPALETRMNQLNNRIADAQRELTSLQLKFESEALDVENLKKESLSVMLMRLIGRYENKLDKETDEMLQAKLEYDRAAERVRELNKEREELSLRIADLRRDKSLYERVLEKREEELRRKPTGEKADKFNALEKEKIEIYKQLTEIEEAISAANRAKQTVDRILEYLNKADNWATYDVWFKGGIITHLNKYGNIDNAEAEFNRLHSQIRDLKRELKDVKMDSSMFYTGVDSATRAIDFWFDNIFTDLNVRERIRSDIDQARKVAGGIQKVISTLENKKAASKKLIDSVELQKKDLLLNL